VTISKIVSFLDVLLDLVYHCGVDVFQRSLFLHLPTLENMVPVRVPIALDLLVYAHELEGFFQLRETAPILLRLSTSLPAFGPAALVNTPDLLGSQRPIHHQDLGDEQLWP
jgi:hypothetical protein